MHSMVTYGLFLWLPKLLRDASALEGFALSSVTSLPFWSRWCNGMIGGTRIARASGSSTSRRARDRGSGCCAPWRPRAACGCWS